MMQLKAILLTLAVVSVGTQAKPSHFYQNLHQTAVPDHIDFAPPVLPATHFHAAAPAPDPAWFPAPAPLAPEFYPIPAPAPAPLLPVPPPAPVLPALPAPAFWPAPAPVPAPVFPAPAPVIPDVHTHLIAAPELHIPAALPALPTFTLAKLPVLETIPIAPSYRAILGPKTTTHHVSVGYAFPKLAAPHAHLHAAPLKLIPHHHHHHHSLF